MTRNERTNERTREEASKRTSRENKRTNRERGGERIRLPTNERASERTDDGRADWKYCYTENCLGGAKNY